MMRWIFVTALLLSLGGNAYLWFTRPAPRAASASLPKSTKTNPTTPAKLRVPKLDPVGDAAKAEDYASLDRSTLEQRIIQTEALIADRIPLEDKLAREPRSQESEAIVRPFLDRVFKTKPGKPRDYDLECHGRVCKIVGKVRSDWWQAIQTPPERAWFRNMSFQGAECHVELAKPDELATALSHGIMAALFMSKDSEACAVGKGGTGKLVFDVGFDPSTRRFSFTASGAAATHPVALCLRGVLERILSEMIVPSNLTSMPRFPIELELPVEPPP